MSLQGKWRHSGEEIISQTIAKYVDLHPEKLIELRVLLEETPDLTKGVAAAKVSARLGRLSAVPQTSEKYWLQRGWLPEDAVLKARERKLSGVRSTKNIKSPFGIEHWLEKINPTTNVKYTVDEAEYKRNSLRPIRKEYWLEKGHPASEATELASQAKDKNNRNGGTKDSAYALRTIGYYQVRGVGLKEAKIKLAEAQTTFSLEKLIAKHGEEEGKWIWAARQEKWQTTLNSKPHEELEDINQRKIWKSGSMSKISQRLFEVIDCSGSRWGKKTEINRGELMIRLPTRNSAMIDFSVGNKLIEFYGDYWHANPTKYKSDDTIVTRKLGPVRASEIWKLDATRETQLKALGYELLIVWEHDYKTNPQKVIQECKNFLNS